MNTANTPKYAVTVVAATPADTPVSSPISGSIDTTTPPPNGPRNPPTYSAARWSDSRYPLTERTRRGPSSQIALELGGERVAVDFGDHIGDIGFGVAAFFETAHVVGDVFVVLGHRGDGLFPFLGERGEFTEGDLDVEDVFDAAQQRDRGLGVRWVRHVVGDGSPERHGGDSRAHARILQNPVDACRPSYRDFSRLNRLAASAL